MVNLNTFFYVVGVIFLFATVSYFSYQYLFNLSDKIKVVILVLACIIFFYVADIMEEKDI